MRIDKFLADMGEGTRSQVKTIIRNKRVAVNGGIITKAEYAVGEGDEVTLDGRKICYRKYEYYMLNKPAGVVSATTDKDCKTVVDFIDSKRRETLFPVGRLDKDTVGLLVITNDGKMAHNLLSPAKHINKTYYAKVDGIVTDEHVMIFSKGIEMHDGTIFKPSVLEIVTSGEISEVLITITEGKFHQIKRMFCAIGMNVIYLKRISMGNLELDVNLKEGEYRELTEKEIDKLCCSGYEEYFKNRTVSDIMEEYSEQHDEWEMINCPDQDAEGKEK